MKYFVYRTKQYGKSLKKLIKAGKIDVKEVDSAVDELSNGRKLVIKYQDHKLGGDLEDYRECHIRPDILLIYKIKNEEILLLLINIGTHSDLF